MVAKKARARPINSREAGTSPDLRWTSGMVVGSITLARTLGPIWKARHQSIQAAVSALIMGEILSQIRDNGPTSGPVTFKAGPARKAREGPPPSAPWKGGCAPSLRP